MPTPKETLSSLEKTGLYVFHGSGVLIEEFEPRQAHDFIDGKNIPDGEPAIFASQFADYAIFMALMNETNCPKGFHASSGMTDGVFHFRATQVTLDQLTAAAQGYVYVFDRAHFKQRNQFEWRALEKVKPVSTVSITRADFIPEIEVIP